MLIRTRVLFAVALLAAGAVGGNAALAGPAPAPAAPAVRIESLTHTVRGVLRAGDRVTVTLRGTAGGAATFHIFGVVTDIGMREIRTGVYQAQPAMYIGTFIVRPGDAARNAAVSATLTVRGSEAMAFSARPVTIDTTPPLLTELRPRPDAIVANSRPNIVVAMFDRESSITRRAARLFVDGRDVTGRASISENVISYTPEAPFPSKSVRVQVIAADVAGNTTQATWTFRTVKGDGLIDSVTINPATPLRSGDVLTVVMTGAPAGRASFTIAGLPASIPMRERRPGVYLGSFAVSSAPAVVNAPLLATLEKGTASSTVAASAGVSLLPVRPPPPTIAPPGRAVVLGQEVVARLIVRGRSFPGMRIDGRIGFEGPAGRGELGEFTALTGGDGAWQTAIGPFILPEGARLSVTVVAVDPAGQRSSPAVLTTNP